MSEPPRHLMRMHGERRGRGWMEPDPSRPFWPGLRALLGVATSVLLVLVALTWLHAQFWR